MEGGDGLARDVGDSGDLRGEDGGSLRAVGGNEEMKRWQVLQMPVAMGPCTLSDCPHSIHRFGGSGFGALGFDFGNGSLGPLRYLWEVTRLASVGCSCFSDEFEVGVLRRGIKASDPKSAF